MTEGEDTAFDTKEEVEEDRILDAKFRIIGELGEGGDSNVYLAEHLYLQKKVSLKLFKNIELDESNPRNFARVQREAITLANLSHPNIVSVTDLGVTEWGAPYIVQEYIEGVDLKSLIERDGEFTKARALRLFIQIASGIAFLHDRGIIHRDIKPGNIIVSTDEEGRETAKLIDLGIAKPDNPGGAVSFLTTTGNIFGSPFYMSPEQCRGGTIDTRTDIYSLGCLMYEALTGTVPLRGQTVLVTMEKHQKEAPVPIAAKRKAAAVGPMFESIIMRCLEKNADNRFENAHRVVHALKNVERLEALKRKKFTIAMVALVSCAIVLSLAISMGRGTITMPSLQLGAEKKSSRNAVKSSHYGTIDKFSEAIMLDTIQGKTADKAYLAALDTAEREKAPLLVRCQISALLCRYYERHRMVDELDKTYITRFKPLLADMDKLLLQKDSPMTGKSLASVVQVQCGGAWAAINKKSWYIAEERLNKAIKLAQRDQSMWQYIPNIKVDLGHVFIHTGRIKEGEALLKETLTDTMRDPKNKGAFIVTVYGHLREAALKENRISEALDLAKTRRAIIAKMNQPTIGEDRWIAQYTELLKQQEAQKKSGITPTAPQSKIEEHVD